MDPAEKFWGGEVARSAAEGATAWVFSRAIYVDGCFH